MATWAICAIVAVASGGAGLGFVLLPVLSASSSPEDAALSGGVLSSILARGFPAVPYAVCVCDVSQEREGFFGIWDISFPDDCLVLHGIRN